MRNFLLFLIMLKMSIAVTLPADIKINEPEVLDKQKFSALSVIPIVNSVNFSAIDSSIYAYSLWTQSQENIGYNPHISALMFTCNDYGYYLRINVSQTDNLFSFSLTDVGVYNAQLGGVRNPNAIASGFDFVGTGPHISYSCGYMEQALMVGQFESGGWWSSYWDPPVDLGPGINKAWWNIGKQFPNGNILFIAVTIENYSDDRKIIYRTYNCNLTTQLAGGYINPDYRRYWGFDINNGIAYVFYYDTLLNIYYRTTTDG
ncbi:MAG: hypothetical protein ABIL20_04945, partial [candidate division WOR-3 bacterium]